ncbi:hypothetical protein BpHYR1_045483, partial [Brachionus plicatilis]
MPEQSENDQEDIVGEDEMQFTETTDPRASTVVTVSAIDSSQNFEKLESHSAQPCNSSNVLRDEGDSEYLSDLELTDPLAQRGSVFPLLNHLRTEYFKMPPTVEVKKEVMSEEEKEKKRKPLLNYVDEQIQKDNKSSKEKIISEFEAMNLQARREVLRKFYVPKASLQRKTAGSELGSACKMQKKNNKSLSIIQWNCFELTRDRIIELSVFLQEFQPDIMSIQEVKLTEEQVNTFIRFSGYFAHFKPRQVNPTHGGGVLILVNNKMNCFKISEFDLDIDHVGIKIDSKGICFNLVSLYVPSNTLKKDLIKSYCELGEDLIILGDLNAK